MKKLFNTFMGAWRYRIALPAKGLLFDLFRHGRFKTDDSIFEIPRDITNSRLRGFCYENSYEMPERMLVKKFVQPEDSVVELGACLGIVSCETNARLRDRSRHLVVEANPKCIPAISRNRDLNHCSFRIENCAASNQREVTFFIDPVNIMSSTLKKGSGIPVTIAGRSLTELSEQGGPFSVLIMDIEGGELDVLEASRQMLPNFRLMIVEFHESIIGADAVNRCYEILQESGFERSDRVESTEAWLQTGRKK